MREPKKHLTRLPKFQNEDDEAAWWASAEGRRFAKQQSSIKASSELSGSPLVNKLNATSSVQIALRLPAPDLAQARDIARRKGIGYQTLLKMLVHEGLRREAKRE